MSTYDINNNPALVKLIIENSKKADEECRKEYPDSLITQFMNDLRLLGYQFEISGQIRGFMPKHKDAILPLAIKYYRNAKYENEKIYFTSFLQIKGLEEIVPMLLEDFYSSNTSELTRTFIGDTLRVIHSKKYIDDYLKIISTSQYGIARVPVIMLVGTFRVEEALPILIDLLDDEQARPHAIYELGKYKREGLRIYFERYINDRRPLTRRFALAALKKLDTNAKTASISVHLNIQSGRE